MNFSSKSKPSFRIADILESEENQKNLRNISDDANVRMKLSPISPINLSLTLASDEKSHYYPESLEQFYRIPKQFPLIPQPQHIRFPPTVDFRSVQEFNPLHFNLMKAPSHLLDKYFYGNHLHSYGNYLLSSSKRKGGQIRFTPSQTQILEQRFSTHKYLSPEERRSLARQLRLSDRQVKTWFQNRRAKYRRIISGQNKIIDPNTALSKYRHISTYNHIPIRNSNNDSSKSSSPSLEDHQHVNDINVDSDDENDERENCVETHKIDILERKHMGDMLQQGTTRWIK